MPQICQIEPGGGTHARNLIHEISQTNDMQKHNSVKFDKDKQESSWYHIS